MDVRSFSTPYRGDEQAARKAVDAQLTAWLKQWPAVRVLDRMWFFGGGSLHCTVSFCNRYEAPTTGRRVTL